LKVPDSLKNRIVVTGYVDDEELAPLYSGALCFIYLSLMEGFGLPPLEAMQCGTPVITSNTSSLPEVVGDSGVMLTPDDTDGLCQWVLRFYQQPALRQTYAHQSIGQAKTFNWERCAQETIDAYYQALAQ
jgi:glycosyltransferase involved in cell wall biosynthesis